jgi:2',3'-cyclic-nucleotide 2'-phosphodiesterase (5'-nucleotidase family)
MKKLAIWGLCLVAIAVAAVLAALPALTPPGPHASEKPAAAPPPQAAPSAADGNSVVTITVLHVNDVHGQTEPHNWGGRNIGGYSRLSTLVAHFRSAGDANLVLLLHAGDELSRGDDLTRKTFGRANFQIMNFLRFDAWTPGNGDFYDGTEVLLQRVREANFPTLNANVSPAAGSAWATSPFVIRQVGPLKVAMFGLCTVHTDAPGGAGLTVADPIEAAARIVPQLRKQADLVVAVTHLGSIVDARLAKEVAGIDLIIGGHTHTVLEHGDTVKGPDGREVLICQAGEQLEYLGCAELKLRPAGRGWQVASARARLILLDANVPEDPAVKALIARLSAATSRPARASQPAAVGAGTK